MSNNYLTTAGSKNLPLLFYFGMKLKPIILFFVLLPLFGNRMVAQNNNPTFQSGGITFPYVEMDQLIAYCEMDSSAFDSIMRGMDFVPEENIYSKGSLDHSKMVFGKSRQFGISIVWISTDSDISLLDRLLRKFARPAGISEEDGYSFMYRKYVITVKANDKGFKYEEINIIDKINYKKNQEQ